MTQLDFTITAEQAREVAVSQRCAAGRCCAGVLDRQTGAEQVVPIPCGSTREAVCPACAHKARVLRMQQCAEGWHLTEEPRIEPADNDDQDLDDE